MSILQCSWYSRCSAPVHYCSPRLCSSRTISLLTIPWKPPWCSSCSEHSLRYVVTSRTFWPSISVGIRWGSFWMWQQPCLRCRGDIFLSNLCCHRRPDQLCWPQPPWGHQSDLETWQSVLWKNREIRQHNAFSLWTDNCANWPNEGDVVERVWSWHVVD